MWQAMKDYSFRVSYTRGGYEKWRSEGLGYIEYRDGEHTVKIGIGSLGVKPCVIVCTQDIDAALKPVLLPRLQMWLKQSGRNWGVQ